MSKISSVGTQLTSPSFVAQENDKQSNVSNYSLFGYKEGTTWLAFRDVVELIKTYVTGNNVIDYGCGSGRSTRFLRTQKLDPLGLDISENMLNEARAIDTKNGQNHRYEKIVSGQIPIADKTCDFIFSSFVFLVIPSKEEMVKVLKEMHRCLSDKGTVIISTGSDKMHLRTAKWVSYDTDFPENASLSSGSLAKVRIKNIGAEFYDYNWLEADYMEAFKNSDFEVVKTVKPLGTEADGQNWEDETKTSPYYIFVLRKKDQN